MTTLEIVQIIGDVLTQLDTLLADPKFPASKPQWQQVYALRKHLDDQQRQLVAADLTDNTPQLAQATTNLQTSADALKKIGSDLTKIASAIKIVSTIASIADQVLALAK